MSMTTLRHQGTDVPVDPVPPLNVPPPGGPPPRPPEGDPPPAAPPMTDPGRTPPVIEPPPGDIVLGRVHARRLREVYRSAGWPCCDAIEVDLLAAGLLARQRSALGHETLRVTDRGIALIADSLVVNRAALSAHEALVEQVAREMTRNGRIAWRGLSLRARVPGAAEGEAARWCIARPDVFSIRNTSVEAYAQPIVHEIKVRRADLMADLRKPDKRAAYLDLGGECWYVLGRDARDRPIATPEEIPAECGVLMLEQGRLVVARPAVHRVLPRMPFAVWMALAKAQPVGGFDDDAQQLLAGLPGEEGEGGAAPLQSPCSGPSEG
ncbi:MULTISPECIES: hypothetical protein [unclassified Variovorax]|uniref:hypothetical protein n=1 Tax=unclassified Variovorax TaxID=663243 RepID=UPI002575A579|nr:MULTISPECIES: hypothetical protein [unclassified Variovorax]MDM0086078.1 hypothetical protein [Variovorax sp. J22G40]MDM0145665.1 hypothetical protein [Variovorax sp. J2P1-31]